MITMDINSTVRVKSEAQTVCESVLVQGEVGLDWTALEHMTVTRWVNTWIQNIKVAIEQSDVSAISKKVLCHITCFGKGNIPKTSNSFKYYFCSLE